MRNTKVILGVLALLCASVASAGRVRNIYTNSKEMPVVQMTTGRSTVLRFPSAPKKVVVGNQNFFNIEFIDSDVTIQPLGVSSSNLFVYGDGYTYGFLLKVGQASEYDDLIFVKSKFEREVEVPSQSDLEKKQLNARFQKKPNIGYVLKLSKRDPFSIKGDILKWNTRIQSYVADLYLDYKSKANLSEENLSVDLIQGKVSLLTVPAVFDCQSGNLKCRIRLFLKEPKRAPSILKILIKDKAQEVEIRFR